jgi:hypothetical protein
MNSVKKKSYKIMFFMAAMLSLSIFAICAGLTSETQFQSNQISQQYALKEYDDSRLRDGVHTRWYPNGIKAEEVRFNKGRKNGAYRAWYENGQKKLQCRFRNDILEGEVAAWFEGGRKRFSVHFTAGKRHDQWTRYHEKGGIVASLNFNRDKLDGGLSAAFERGYGNGSGMSYAIKAGFQNGVMVGSFHLAHTDPYGHTVIANGILLDNGGVKLDRQRNVELATDNTLSVDYGRFRKTYHRLQQFFIDEINRHVMTKFSLDFCNRSENIWPCQFPQGTI